METVTVMDNIEITTLVLGRNQTNCYILRVPGGKTALIIDPADGADTIISKCEELQMEPVAMLLTHGHFDHVLAVEELRRRFKIPLSSGESEQIDYGISTDGWLMDGDVVEEAGCGLRVIETPGHTAGGVCYYQPEAKVLFSGDTLFKGTFGRTDLPTGSMEDIRHSIIQVLFKLPDDVTVYPGHGGKTTMGYEKKANYIRTLF